MFSKKEKDSDEKVILVFNTACFGDVLLCNSLVQNIKIAFPKSKVVFVCDKNWVDISRYQYGVDDVLVYDKRGVHKGIKGMIKFLKEYPYKKPYISFVTYRNLRSQLVSFLLGAKHIEQGKKLKGNVSTQEKHTNLLKHYVNGEISNLPIKFVLPDNVENPLRKTLPDQKYLTLCCVSKNIIKDMPLSTTEELINKINNQTEYKVVLVGAGDSSKQYAEQLKKMGCEFIDFTNKTTLLELGKVLKDSEGLISIDTGTMHYGYALGVKTCCIFYNSESTDLWAPKKEVYPNTVLITKNISADEIFNQMIDLIS